VNRKIRTIQLFITTFVKYVFFAVILGLKMFEASYLSLLRLCHLVVNPEGDGHRRHLSDASLQTNGGSVVSSGDDDGNDTTILIFMVLYYGTAVLVFLLVLFCVIAAITCCVVRCCCYDPNTSRDERELDDETKLVQRALCLSILEEHSKEITEDDLIPVTPVDQNIEEIDIEKNEEIRQAYAFRILRPHIDEEKEIVSEHCSICLESYSVGEYAAWSSTSKCRKFHTPI